MKSRLTWRGLLGALMWLVSIAAAVWVGWFPTDPLLCMAIGMAFGGLFGWCSHGIWTYEIDEEEAEKEIDAMLEDTSPTPEGN